MEPGRASGCEVEACRSQLEPQHKQAALKTNPWLMSCSGVEGMDPTETSALCSDAGCPLAWELEKLPWVSREATICVSCRKPAASSPSSTPQMWVFMPHPSGGTSGKQGSASPVCRSQSHQGAGDTVPAHTVHNRRAGQRAKPAVRVR